MAHKHRWSALGTAVVIFGLHVGETDRRCLDCGAIKKPTKAELAYWAKVSRGQWSAA